MTFGLVRTILHQVKADSSEYDLGSVLISIASRMEPRYVELANLIVKRITEGDIAVGTRLPNELTLAKQYAVSRTTIRSALNIVEGLGLISRQRRTGTVVVSKTSTDTYTKSVHTIEDLVHYASHTKRNVTDVTELVADTTLAEVLECKPGQSWLRVQMLRTEISGDGAPVCWTDAYLEPRIGHTILPLVDDGTGLLTNLVERKTGTSVFEVKQEIGATAVSERVAAQLGAKVSAPTLQITRRYYDRAKQMFLITISTYPPEKFKFTFWMHRSKSVAL